MVVLAVVVVLVGVVVLAVDEGEIATVAVAVAVDDDCSRAASFDPHAAAGPTTDLERGEAFSVANCALCHGGNLTGSDRGPSLLDPIYGRDQLTDAEFAAAGRNRVEERLWDFGDMPGNDSCSDAQVAAVIAFVLVEQAGEPGG